MKTSEISDKTYTLNSQDSYYDSEKMILKIFLPEDVVENPYQYTIFDVSQTVNGKHQNALFIYMKKTDDDATDLSPYDDDKCECNCTIEFNRIIPMSNLSGFSPFDSETNDAVVTIYHDSEIDETYKQTCAEKLFLEVATITTSVITNGNFQTNMLLMAGTPKKTGISSIRRSR